MTQAETRRALENQQQVLVIVWVAFFASLLIYLLLPQIIFRGPSSTSDPSTDRIREVLWVITVIEVGILLWWKRRFLTKESILEGLSEGGGTRVASKYFSGKIVAFSIGESIAIYGLISAFIGRNIWDQVVFSVVSGFLLINLYPSRDFFKELVREMEGRSEL